MAHCLLQLKQSSGSWANLLRAVVQKVQAQWFSSWHVSSLSVMKSLKLPTPDDGIVNKKPPLHLAPMGSIIDLLLFGFSPALSALFPLAPRVELPFLWDGCMVIGDPSLWSRFPFQTHCSWWLKVWMKWLCELWLPWNLDSNWPGSYTDMQVRHEKVIHTEQHLPTQRWTYGHHTLSWEPVPPNKIVLADQRFFSILSGSRIPSSSLIPNYLLLTFKIMLLLHVLGLCSAPGDQRRAPEPLELKLEMAVSWHVDAGNQNWVLCKSS